jgi:hypothetical protein
MPTAHESKFRSDCVSRWLDEATILRVGALIEAGTKRNTVTRIFDCLVAD